MQTDSIIEAILFYKGEPVSTGELARLTGVNGTELEQALQTLAHKLDGRGLALLRAGDEVELRTSADAAVLLGKLRTEELTRDLGKAGSETLAIILYHGPVSRATVDYIRGVNSTFIIRSLLVRGLVERIPNESDQRSFLYQPTVELLAHLGVAKVEDLPNYRAIRDELANAENNGPEAPQQP